MKDIAVHTFSVTLSSPLTRIDQIESKLELSYETQAEVPFYIEIKVRTDRSLSYIFFLQNGDYMTIYNGTLYSFDDINTNFQKQRVFAIANGRESYLNTYTVMLFSDIPQRMTLIIEVTNSDVGYYKEVRHIVMIQKEMMNYDRPYYILGSFAYYDKENYAFWRSSAGSSRCIKRH